MGVHIVVPTVADRQSIQRLVGSDVHVLVPGDVITGRKITSLIVMGDVFIRARGAAFGDISETLHAHIKDWLDHVVGKAGAVSYLYPNHG